jgi:hypothetical protein
MTTYLNLKTSQGTETVDEFTRGKDSPENPIQYRKYINQMVNEYHLSGMNVYKSSRCTKEWRNK